MVSTCCKHSKMSDHEYRAGQVRPSMRIADSSQHGSWAQQTSRHSPSTLHALPRQLSPWEWRTANFQALPKCHPCASQSALAMRAEHSKQANKLPPSIAHAPPRQLSPLELRIASCQALPRYLPCASQTALTMGVASCKLPSISQVPFMRFTESSRHVS